MGAGIRLGDMITVDADHRKNFRTFSPLCFGHALLTGMTSVGTTETIIDSGAGLPGTKNVCGSVSTCVNEL